LRKNPSFKKAPSALTYCFSERKPKEGLATVYLPAKITRDTKTIVFLHGHGGSLLAYLYFLSSTYPNHIIICPAYGIDPSSIPLGYVLEAENAVAARIKSKLNKPLLIGLSAGGFSACKLYTQKPDAARGVICLGAFVPAECMKQLNKSLTMHLLVGEKEPYVSNGAFKRQMNSLKPRLKTLDWQAIPAADQFFLLSHEAESRKILLQWER
jgi:predicted esterase